MPSSGVQTCGSEEHTSELQSHDNLVCRLLLEKKNTPHTSPHEYPAPTHPPPPPRTPLRTPRRARRQQRTPGRSAGGARGRGRIGFFLKDRAPPESSPFPPNTPFRS